MEEKSGVEIGPNAKVSILFLGGILIAAIAGASWVAQVNGRLSSIEEALVRPHPDEWRGADMRRWAGELRSANPTLVVPYPEPR